MNNSNANPAIKDEYLDTVPLRFALDKHKSLIASRTELKAMTSGIVTLSKVMGGYGNAVKIKHDDGTQTLYGHLSKMQIRQDSTNIIWLSVPRSL